ncbi:MAG: hypothetical protein GYB33_08675 [Gammaproteobacteria bacterium]|nr:hypothetical protein [Gammaproteobacteria bacterium]
MIKRLTGYFSAITLYRIATEARDRSSESQEQALVSLMFSFNALEAFINETVTCCKMTTVGRLAEHEKTYYSIMNDLQKNKASTQIKFDLGKLLLSGVSWNHNEKPYQDFKLLLKVRNELVHRKSEMHEEELVKGVGFIEKTINDHPKFFKELQSKKLIYNSSLDCSWIDLVQNISFASWCCDTALSMNQAFLNSIKDVPDSNLKNKMVEALGFQ